MLNTVSAKAWEKIGIRKRAGVLAPLFSVYSRDSLGIGDFGDLAKLIDWAAFTGNTILQLLPMNEMGAVFCPYDSLSSFALEPAYLSLDALPASRQEYFQKEIGNSKVAFPAGTAFLNYRIKEEKLRLLRDMFLREGFRDHSEVEVFEKENAYWLEDFVLFKALKDYYKGLPWYEWQPAHKNRAKEALDIFRRGHEEEISFQLWLQWLIYKQFTEAKRCAEKKRILLKGDLPILVSRDSADVWAHPEFFKLEFAAGAPPDMYCAKGQRWGMPTYDWQRIAADGYRYVKEKLKYAENFYDILRIDHVVGLFRIWSIPYNEPLENKGLNGFFDPADESKWAQHGRGILSMMIENTKMLLCAEDLGIIPPACPQALKEFGIPGNDVQRWMKDWQFKHDFLSSDGYRFLSVSMLSTHDTTNWPAWWEYEAGTVDEALFARKCNERGIDYGRVASDLFDFNRSCHGRLRWLDNIDSVDKLVWILGRKKEELADFIDIYKNTYGEKEKLWRQLGLYGPMREKADLEIVRAALKISLEANSIFCVNTIIDWLYLADIFKGDTYQYRINTPGTVCERNWSLVLPVFIEELFRHKVSEDIKAMVAASGRV